MGLGLGLARLLLLLLVASSVDKFIRDKLQFGLKTVAELELEMETETETRSAPNGCDSAPVQLHMLMFVATLRSSCHRSIKAVSRQLELELGKELMLELELELETEFRLALVL